MTEHFLPIERNTHRTPRKYRRVAVRLAQDYRLEEVAYLFGVTSGAVQKWTQDPENHPQDYVGTIELL